MLNSVILDVAIGLAFLYLLMSLIASVVQEILATFMQLRPANLQRGMRSLLSGSSIEAGPDLVDNIYTHGLVRGLYSDPNVDLNPNTQERKAMNADQSPAAKFKRTLNSLRRVDWLRRLLRKLIGIQPEKEIAGVSNQMLLPAYIPSHTFALAMIDILNRNKAMGADAMNEIHGFLAWHHSQFRDNKATEALLALATDAQGNLKKFELNLENWYNAGMDRASGWYKKYTQTILLVIGLVMAIIFNVDSVRVAKVLWFDRDARQGMVDAASQYMKDHPQAAKTDTTPASGTTDNTGTTGTPDTGAGSPQPATPTAGAAGNGQFNAADLQNRLNATVEQFNVVTKASLLPVGWKRPFRENWTYLSDQTGAASWRILEMFPGWLITALAISLGAPFWFDMLNKFMVVRSTVKPQEKSLPEASKS